MKTKCAIVISLVVPLLAACAPPSPPPPAVVPAPPPPAAAPPPPPPEAAPSTAPIPIRTLSCAEMIGASDDDRAAASMFFIGYQASSTGVHDLSIAQIQAIEGKALGICASKPALPAARAFRIAVVTRGR